MALDLIHTLTEGDKEPEVFVYPDLDYKELAKTEKALIHVLLALNKWAMDEANGLVAKMPPSTIKVTLVSDVTINKDGVFFAGQKNVWPNLQLDEVAFIRGVLAGGMARLESSIADKVKRGKGSKK